MSFYQPFLYVLKINHRLSTILVVPWPILPKIKLTHLKRRKDLIYKELPSRYTKVKTYNPRKVYHTRVLTIPTYLTTLIRPFCKIHFSIPDSCLGTRYSRKYLTRFLLLRYFPLFSPPFSLLSSRTFSVLLSEFSFSMVLLLWLVKWLVNERRFIAHTSNELGVLLGYHILEKNMSSPSTPGLCILKRT